MKNFIKKAIQTIQFIRRIINSNRKIRNIYKLNKEKYQSGFDKQQLIAHKKKWYLLKKRVNDKWFKVYSYISNKSSADFVPEDIYYAIIEPIMNNPDFLIAYKDKNFYDKYYSKNLFPKTLLRNMDGTYYNRDYHPINLEEDNNNLYRHLADEKKIITKPSVGASGGTKVYLFELKNGIYINGNHDILSIDFLKINYGKNFVIQVYIDQHDHFKKFNISSLNTVRIFTYRSVKTEEIIVLHAVQRMGKKGKIVDNQASGGISCGIDRDGNLKDFAVDKYGHISKESPSGVLFRNAGNVINFKEMKQIASDLARRTYYARLLGFDFCVDKNNNVKLIEINNKYLEINFLQMNNGPLFNDYTDEIIQYCSSHKH